MAYIKRNGTTDHLRALQPAASGLDPVLQSKFFLTRLKPFVISQLEKRFFRSIGVKALIKVFKDLTPDAALLDMFYESLRTRSKV